MNSLQKEWLHDAGLWRASDLKTRTSTRDSSAQSTGFSQLDSLLIDGGWPQSGLVEILCDRYGVGELRLLSSALVRSGSETRWTVLINPPYVPYAPAFQALGVRVDDLVVVHPGSHTEALWAFEEAVRSGACQSVLAWLNEGNLKDKQLRRIQAKSKEREVFGVLFRPLVAERRPSPAELRIKIEKQSVERDLVVSILKRRGGWQVNSLELTLPWGPTMDETDRARQLLIDWERACRSMKSVPL